MLELDARDAGDGGSHDVGRIEASAESDLDYGTIDTRLREQRERDRRRRVEEARPRLERPVAQRVEGRPDSLDRRYELRGLDLAPADAESLDPALEMG